MNEGLILAAGGLTTLVLMLAAMPALIRYLHKLKFGQTEREEGLASHKSKTGTPTMGGLAFIIVPLVVYAVFSLFTPYGFSLNTTIIWMAYVGYGLIGFLDDFIIVVQKNNEGLKPWAKFGLQSLLAIVFYMMYTQTNSTEIIIPVADVSINLSWFYFILVFIMFTGTSNAVNLTDGVDGLAAGLAAIALVPFSVFAFMQSQDSIGVICVLVIAALLGYLKFNLHPAKVFMGDTGSLALGGLLAAVAMVLKQEVLLIVIGGVFIAETLSVMIQVAVYKKTKKRVFRMAPLHHHFEKGGWDEGKVVDRFWMAGGILAIIGLLLGGM